MSPHAEQIALNATSIHIGRISFRASVSCFLSCSKRVRPPAQSRYLRVPDHTCVSTDSIDLAVVWSPKSPSLNEVATEERRHETRTSAPRRSSVHSTAGSINPISFFHAASASIPRAGTIVPPVPRALEAKYLCIARCRLHPVSISSTRHRSSAYA